MYFRECNNKNYLIVEYGLLHAVSTATNTSEVLMILRLSYTKCLLNQEIHLVQPLIILVMLRLKL
jgi:hypothetical protein